MRPCCPGSPSCSPRASPPGPSARCPRFTSLPTHPDPCPCFIAQSLVTVSSLLPPSTTCLSLVLTRNEWVPGHSCTVERSTDGAQITLPDVYLNPTTVPKGTLLPLNSSSLAPPNNTKMLLVNLTQPLLPNGQLRCEILPRANSCLRCSCTLHCRTPIWLQTV